MLDLAERMMKKQKKESVNVRVSEEKNRVMCSLSLYREDKMFFPGKV